LLVIQHLLNLGRQARGQRRTVKVIGQHRLTIALNPFQQLGHGPGRLKLPRQPDQAKQGQT
jgi:hypothetical protein